MTEQDELVVLQRAKEKFPNETPRIISDNGSQFLAKDFKEFIRICGMTHVRTSPYYPQSNGKLERFHGSIKGECIRPGTPISLEDAMRIVGRVRRALQPGPLAQRDRLRRAGGQAGGPRGGNLRRPRPQAGRGARAQKGATRGGPLADGCLIERNTLR